LENGDHAPSEEEISAEPQIEKVRGEGMETHTMKPGDVRIFKPRRSVVLAVGIFAKRQGRYLRIDITGSGKHTTVENNPHSERYHRTLFRNMRRQLIENGCWSFGDEGSETEVQER